MGEESNRALCPGVQKSQLALNGLKKSLLHYLKCLHAEIRLDKVNGRRIKQVFVSCCPEVTVSPKWVKEISDISLHYLKCLHAEIRLDEVNG